MGNLSKKQMMERKDPLVRKYASDLGTNLRQIRKDQGLTQKKLGLMIGSEHSRISNIECGYVALSIPDLVKLSRALDVDPCQLADLSPLKLADYPEQANGHARL